ncbi:MAG: TerB N-terminal domain-containing protein [Desulfatirhabdiaceae bacterium]
MEIIIGLIVLYLIYRIFKGFSGTGKSTKTNEVTLRVEVSKPGDYSSSYNRSTRPSDPPAKWYGPSMSVKVKDYEIPGGLVYVGSNLPDHYGYENDACLIDPSLKVSAAEPWEAGDQMGYWPKFHNIPAKSRGAYLKWLAGGRSEPEAYIGYVFLFFYGLERRLIVDGAEGKVSSQERSAIVNEVRRLLKIYDGNRSFSGYANNFLAMEWALYQSDNPVPSYINFDDRYCTAPFQLVLAKHVEAGKAIPADMALQWYRLNPNMSLRTPARRCEKEFKYLFTRRYQKKFGDGITVKPNKTRLKIDYRAASPSIRGDMKLNVPDLPNPFILTEPINKISEIVDECTQELDPYSRFLGRKGSDPKSLTALSLIPKELITQSTGAKSIRDRLARICQSGIGFLPLETLYKTIGQNPPIKLLKKELESLASFIDNMDYGIAPDIRYHSMKPTIDGNVAIFPKGHGMNFRPSKEFQTVATILQLGAMVSQIDKDFTSEEEAALQSLISDDRELTSIEKDSLSAFLHWCIRTPQNAASIKSSLCGVSETEKSAISHILITVAHADGEIKPEEIKQLEKLYTTLGLDKEQVIGDIHALAVNSGPVTVGIKDQDTSYAIPQPAKPLGISKGFVLNEELIRIRKEETKQVKIVLEDIFTEQEKEAEAPLAGATVSTNPLSLLDSAHQSLFNNLLDKETWERAAFQETCKSLGLMVDGAMEVLNEWAFENAKAPLIEDGETIYVDVSLAKEIVDVQ